MVNYHNYNNVKLVIDNQSILADSAALSINPALSLREEIDLKGGFEYVADNGIQASLTIGYFLVGSDPLKPFLDSKTPITVEAGGLTLQKGYLNNYSLAGAPHGPVRIDATLVFYEDFGGSFSPTTLPDKDYDYLRLSDMELAFQGIDATSKIKALSYEMSCETEPIYHIGDLTPEEIRFNKKTQGLRVSTYNFEEALPYVGKDVEFTFTLGPETYIINGRLQSKSVNFTFGEKINAEFNVSTTSYGGAPTITNDAPSGGSLNIGQTFTITGTNLGSTSAVYFNNNVKANKFVSISDTEIKVKIPRFARSGPYKVTTAGGEVVRPAISINSVFVP